MTNIKIKRFKKSIIKYIVYVVCPIFVFFYLIGQLGIISGSSMENTYKNNNVIYYEKITHRLGKLKHFDVIVFKKDKTEYIKRVIALPGDTIYINNNNEIIVNDKKISTKYFKEKILSRGIAGNKQTLKENEYFVIGDNVNNSKDSRSKSIGLVNYYDIKGKVIFKL